MNRATSKPAATTKRAQPKPHPSSKPQNRSPLKDLNAGVVFKSRSSICSSTASSSVEPTSGCSRFRLSNSSSSCSNATNHHRSDCNSGNPRNSTISKPRLRSCKPLDHGRKISDQFTDSDVERVTKVIRLRPRQMISQKKVISGGRNDLLSRSRRVEGAAGKSGKDFEFTPLGYKTGSAFGFGKVLGSTSSMCDKNDGGSGSGNTPPAEATVSPEIQCGSTVMPIATPICFGAGHVLSGVSDKRKYRPRGVLVVGGNCNGIDGFNNLNEDADGIGDVDGGCALVPPFPVEASVHWLLSPCDEDDVEQNGDCELLTSVPLQSSLSGSSGYGTSSNNSKDKNAKTFSNMLVSPDGLVFQYLLDSPSDKMASTPSHSPLFTTPNGEGAISWFDEKTFSNLAVPNSPCSKDTLGSENVLQTPESCSGLPWLHADGKSNLDSAVDGLLGTSLSSERQIFVSEQSDSSFEFDCHLKSASSFEYNQVKYHWHKSSWISDTIVENEQQSQFSISWRDGLSCHQVEMDNSDCYRILSDGEDKKVQYYADPASPSSKLREINTALFVKKMDVNNAGCVNRNENPILQQNSQFAESISLDGGSLASSGDSVWDMCYKNNLFQVE